MAKSLRSKTKRAFRKIKREDPKSDYHIRDKLRLQRLNEKLKVLTPVSDVEDEDVEDETVAQPTASASMQEDGNSNSNSKQGDSKAGPSTSTSTSTMQTEETEEPPKKISTGGPRQSANLEWRKKVGMGPKKRTSANSTTFSKPKNYKSPGRARRARN